MKCGPVVIRNTELSGYDDVAGNHPIFEYNGLQQVTDVSLAGPDVARLALEAELQNLGTTQFLTQAVTTAIKKDLIDEILRGSSQEPAPQTHPESSVAAPSDRTLNGHQSIAPISSRVS
jgi:hypothetical protein